MAIIEIAPASPDHIPVLAATLRPADRLEIWASSLVTPEEGLRLSLSFSPWARTMLLDGVPFCMFGVAAASPLCRHGMPWLLGSELIETHARPFLRLSKKHLPEMTAQFPILSNHVDARNPVAIRWLRWLGFTLAPAIAHGPFNMPFHPFELRMPSHVCHQPLDGRSRSSGDRRCRNVGL